MQPVLENVSEQLFCLNFWTLQYYIILSNARSIIH